MCVCVCVCVCVFVFLALSCDCVCVLTRWPSTGWEPFIEPWPCFLTWHQQAAGRLHPPRLKLGVRAKQRLDVNITSVLLGRLTAAAAAAAVSGCAPAPHSHTAVLLLSLEV